MMLAVPGCARGSSKSKATASLKCAAYAIAFASTVFLAPAAPAREATEAEKSALTDIVREFNAAMARQDCYEVVSMSLAPGVTALLASKAGMDAQVLLNSVAQQTKEALAKVKIERFSMNSADAVYKQTPSGEPYATIPTETLIAVPQHGRVLGKEQTLAIMDSSHWYLVRVSEPQQISLLREAYPEFKDVQFIPAVMEIVKE